ncbi:uncharacterized protein [Nicotiana tomentosiformis]|uniref:uncharacterized protein n=1 Tax=Nicotiana tomentosiformis TaxID=4098 RepID=UPI00388C9BDC
MKDRGRGRHYSRVKGTDRTTTRAAPTDPPVTPVQEQVPVVDEPVGPAQAPIVPIVIQGLKKAVAQILTICAGLAKFTGAAFRWWEAYESRRSVGAAPFTWQEFSVLFLEKERIRRFIDGLTYQLRLLMTQERVFGATFDEVVDIARQIEMFYHGRGRSYRHAQTTRPVHRGASSNHGSYSTHQGQSSLSALLSQSSSHAPLVQGSSAPGASSGYSGSQGSIQSPPPPSSESCFKCREFGHMWRKCPHRPGGLVQQRIQAATSTPVTSPPTQPARGGAQPARGRPRGGGRSGGGQARFYVILARPDVVASDAVITGIVSVCHRDAPVLFDPGFTYS